MSNVDEFVEQDAYYNVVMAQFQDIRDRISHVQQTYDVLEHFELKVSKEHRESLNEALKQIQDLSGHVETVESTRDTNTETFKKQLLQDIPVLDAEITELLAEAQQPQFLENSDKFEMLKQLTEIEEKFKKLNLTADKYNHQLQVLSAPVTVFKDLDECYQEITMRCLMWRSLHEWQELSERWKITLFTEIDAANISKLADKYFRDVMRIEKNLPANPVQEKLKILVNQFKEAMPIVTALRNEKLEPNHWFQIKNLINKDIDVKKEDFTLQSLIALDVN